jgi:MerR family transcriptional regulator/heat shock protein HspR
MGVDRLDDQDYPALSVGQAAELLGVQQAFLRRLDAAGVLRPHRSAGGHRRYSRRQLTRAARMRELFDQGHSLAAATQILALEDDVGRVRDERDQVRDERNLARRQRDEAREQRDEARQQRDQAREQRDQAREERDEAYRRLGELAADPVARHRRAEASRPGSPTPAAAGATDEAAAGSG